MTNTQELRNAIHIANNNTSGKHIEILVNKGKYENATNITIRRNNITIRSSTNNPAHVVLSGSGMKKKSPVEVIFDISASNVTLSGMTLRNVSHHLIQVRAEKDVDFFSLDNCILEDSYQQLLKVSGSDNDKFSDFGIIKNSRFEYTEGVGPNFYIGGIDAHKSRGWIVQNNTFANIASPAGRVAEHAIHFWRGSFDNTIINNIIINSDRGIGFGLGNNKNQSKGGFIAFNKITHDNPSHAFADVGISLESSPRTIITNNEIQLNSSYPNAIEYRFPSTQDVVITSNITNKSIVARDGADGTLLANTSAGIPEYYWNLLLYNLKRAVRYINE
ncbi:right-handed parallel beta-helix repeat-containing protein [Alteromonas sp. RW2A1]|uniref:right-handed parallel beta-helix repeat-containing protein n=1 Tax=Alteromonas sp. RW2A1 TaxID=1917158 RepID=UPI000A8D2334|nr:right-handed parallel beta-helix repeat-containing protein [Alteromonas sp. RW2A1]